MQVILACESACWAKKRVGIFNSKFQCALFNPTYETKTNIKLSSQILFLRENQLLNV